jgi:hypothetical protein
MSELYCVGNIKNGKPKKDLWLPFSLVRFFWASKRNEQGYFGQAKEPSGQKIMILKIK